MADNVVANAGAGGSTFATDDIAGVHHPYTKVEWGPADTANSVDDAAGKRLPIKLAESSATVTVAGTVTTTPPANASTNVAQVAGTAADVNSGLKSAGTLRVVLATDQPQLTNKILVTPDSVALPANQSVNVSQVAGTTPDTNSGNKSAGTLRVVLATDQPALSTPMPVSDGGGSLTVDGSVSVSSVPQTVQKGAANIANGQVSLNGTAANVVSSRATRRSVTIVNHGTIDVYVGVATVTTANGVLLPGIKGAAITLFTTAAVQGITGGTAQTVSYIEEYE